MLFTSPADRAPTQLNRLFFRLEEITRAANLDGIAAKLNDVPDQRFAGDAFPLFFLLFQHAAALYDQNERASALIAGNIGQNAMEQRETESRGDTRC